MKKIQLFSPVYSVDECLAEIRKCLEAGWTGLGFKTLEFEEAWKNYTGLPHAHFLNSSTQGLHLAMKIFKHELNWRDGDEIITTPLTFVSTNHAILYENLKPVFADVDETLCLDPQSVREKIGPKTKAVVFVGFGGNAGKLGEISQICKEHNLILILDAAHMSGTRYHERHIGSEADCAVFSYHAVKNLSTGDGGMICFKEKFLDEEARKWSWMGINNDTFSRAGKGGYKWLYDVEHLGLKAHGNSIMAAIALVQLKYLDRDNEMRRRYCDLYARLLENNSQIKLVKHFDDCVSSRHLFQIRVPAALRDILILFLNAKEIYPGVHYRLNTDYKMYDYASGTCPRAEEAAKEIISLPLHLRLTEEDIKYVCKNINIFLEMISLPLDSNLTDEETRNICQKIIKLLRE